MTTSVMIVYPAISPLTGDRHAPEQVIGMTGLGDRHRPEPLIDFNGIRINFREFVGYLFDDERLINKGTKIMHALLAAQSPRLTHIASQMKGKSERNYKTIQRSLTQYK
jgi:hypothetical protein